VSTPPGKNFAAHDPDKKVAASSPGEKHGGFKPPLLDLRLCLRSQQRDLDGSLRLLRVNDDRSVGENID